MTSRRAFLKAGGLALVGLGLGGVPGFMARAADSQKRIALYKRTKVLVCIFQRGAMDGLMAVSPFNDPYLRAARPDLFMSPARNGTGKSLVDLDGTFGLHPALQAFESLFREKRLAIVHGMGSPNNTRSHFDAQDYMESGTPFSKSTASGWLNRAVGLLGHDASPFQAVSLTSAMPRSLYGDQPALAIRDLKDFALQSKGTPLDLSTTAQSFESLYDQTSSALLKQTGKESFEAMKILQQAQNGKYTPAPGVVYPATTLGTSLKQIAQLVKMDVGLEVAFAESGGWDTHFNQGAGNGTFARNAQDFSSSIAALWADLAAYQDDVTILTMTEFGRTVKQNGTRGTDHGRASCSFIIGNDVKGGLVHGAMQPLAVENLEDGRDLAVTTDFRSIFSEVAGTHLAIQNNRVLFPDWEGKRTGVMRTA
jgi:uncharacterized protein (DUF1501 family)